MNRAQDANDGGVPSTSSALRGVHHIVGLPIAAIAFHRPCARPNLTGQPKTTHRARLALQIQNRNAVGDTANCRMSFAGGLSSQTASIFASRIYRCTGDNALRSDGMVHTQQPTWLHLHGCCSP